MPLGHPALMPARRGRMTHNRLEVLAMAHSGNGWVSCWMRSGRYTYRRVVVHTTNPDHLTPSTGKRSDRPPLHVASPLPGREVQVANAVPRGPYSG